MDICGITLGADYHKRIRVSMGSLSAGHLQAYVHSYEGVAPVDVCDFEPSLTHTASFIKDLPSPIPKPMDVIMVLDVSGSMAGGTPKKIDILHEVAQDFLNTWASGGVFKPEDHVGAVFFETTASPYLGAGDFLVPFTVNPTTPGSPWMQLYNEVGTHLTGNTTAMGEGLQEALDRFDDTSDHLRHIILFTNGMQNTGDLVEDSGPPDYYKTLKGQNLRSYGVPIYTIGTGVASGSPYEELLEDIAIQTGATSTFTTDPTSDLASAFYTDLVDMLRNNTLEIVAVNSDLINKEQGEVTHTYQVNRAAKRGIFIVSWHAIDPLDKNPQAITMEVVGPEAVGTVAQGVTRDGAHFHIRNVTFPLSGFPANAHEGEWQIIIRENLEGSSAHYHAALFVDEAQFHYRVGAAPRDYGTGEDILLTASLAVDGQPIADADLIQAKVTRPRLPLGTFLHQRNLADLDLKTNPTGVHEDNFPNRYSRKLYRLITEKNLGYLLEPIEDPDPVYLFDSGDKDAHGDTVEGDGIYSALYKTTKFPGQYEFDFTIEGEHPVVGKYARSEKSEVMVRVKTLDPRESEATHDDLGGGKYLITFIPADRFENFLGPGYVERIRIISSAGDVLPVEDTRENGTYTARLSNVPKGTDPIVTISVHGETLIEKPLSKLLPSKRWSLGVYGVRNLPHKTLDKSYDAGYGFDVFLEYLLSPRVSAVVAFDYNGFSAKLTGADDLNILNLSGHLKVYPVIGTFQFAFFGGPGFYFLDPGDDKFGLHGGTVAEWRITSRFSLEGRYTYNHVFTSGDSSAFSAFNAGVRYRF